MEFQEIVPASHPCPALIAVVHFNTSVKLALKITSQAFRLGITMISLFQLRVTVIYCCHPLPSQCYIYCIYTLFALQVSISVLAMPKIHIVSAFGDYKLQFR